MTKVEHAINRARSSIFKCAFDLCKILYKKNIFWRSTFLSNTRYFGRFAERNRDGCSVILLERKSIDDSRSLFAKGFELLGLREELEKHPLSCKFIRALVRLILNLLAERAVHSFFTPPPLSPSFFTFSSLVSSSARERRVESTWRRERGKNYGSLLNALRSPVKFLEIQ